MQQLGNILNEKHNSCYPTIKDRDKNFLFEIREIKKFRIREDEVDEYIAGVNENVNSDGTESTETEKNEFEVTDNYGYELEEAYKEIGEHLSPTWDYVFKQYGGTRTI